MTISADTLPIDDSRLPPPAGGDLATLAEHIAIALDEAAQAHVLVEGLLGEPRPQGADWADRIRAALANRDAKLHALGHAALSWRLVGGVVELIDPERQGAPEPRADADPPPVAPVDPVPHATLAPPASAESLSALANGFHSRVGASAFQHDRGGATLRAILDEVRPAGALDTAEAVQEEIDGLRRALGGAEHRWGPLPRDAKRDLLALCVCRARRLQAEGALAKGAADDVDRLLRRMSAYSSAERPGYVEGLAQHHTPHRGSWSADAQHWWEQLAHERAEAPPTVPPNPERCLADLLAVVSAGALDTERLRAAALSCLDAGLDSDEPRLIKLLVPYGGHLSGDRRLKPLRRAVRVAADAEAEAEVAEDAPTEPWMYAAYTQGRSAVIVGGDRRDRAERRLADAFGFAKVAWESGAHPRRLEAIGTRIASGTVDFVIVLTRFLSHKAYETLESSFRPGSTTRRVLVDQGYGLRQIRAALERVLVAEDVAGGR